MQPEDSAFRAFYDSELVPVLKSLEVERKKLSNISLIIFSVATMIVVLALIIMNISEMGSNQQFYVIAFIILITGFGRSHLTDNLTRGFKKDIISKIVTFVDENLQYTPNMGVTLAEFQKSKIFTEKVDRYVCEDLVSGNLGRTKIYFSEVQAEHKERGLGKNDDWHSVFKGIFLIADFNKHFQGQTLVLSDDAENLLGSLGTVFQKLKKGGDKLIKLEDPEFEKEFAVYGSDPVETRYILSPSLMQRITRLRNKSYGLQLSFIDSHVFIAIPFEKNLFEISCSSSFLNYNLLKTYIDDLQLATGIVEELNLNTRIWSKV